MWDLTLARASARFDGDDKEDSEVVIVDAVFCLLVAVEGAVVGLSDEGVG